MRVFSLLAFDGPGFTATGPFGHEVSSQSTKQLLPQLQTLFAGASLTYSLSKVSERIEAALEADAFQGHLLLLSSLGHETAHAVYVQ